MRQPTRHRHVKRVTEAALSPSGAARSRLVASWRRSYVKHALDPGDAQRRDRVCERQLCNIRGASGDLHVLASDAIDRLFQRVRMSGCGVFLTDAQGVILDQRVGDGDRADFDGWNLTEGSDWSESSEGTNGVGTCLAEERAVIIHRDEHYSLRNIAMSCIDAPIFGPDGRLMGALDISSARADQSGALNALMRDAVQRSAAQIEEIAFRRAFPGARIVLIETDSSDPAALPGLLAVDAHDVVIGATRAARRRFGLSSEGGPGERTLPLPCADLLGNVGRQGGFDGAEAAALRRALLRSGGNASAAAKALGIGRATLYRRMKRLGLDGAPND